MPRRVEAGFSLMEIMVALFIVGLATSFIVLSFPRSGSALSDAEQEIAGVLNDVKSAARTSGEPHGIRLGEGGLHVVVYREGQWQRQPAFRMRKAEWQDRVRIQRIDNTSSSSREAETGIENRPVVWFDGSGIAASTPFEIASDEGRVRFELDLSGQIREQSIVR